MGQSMRRAMIALGLAEPDAQPDSRTHQDRPAGPREVEGRTEGRSERPVNEHHRGEQPRHSSSRTSSRSAEQTSVRSAPPSSSRAEPFSGRAESTAETGGVRRGGESRRDAEYRAPVTPIKRAPSTSRENADDMRTITTVHPRSYNDAKSVGESFRDGTPVIMDLTDLGEAEAKRLVDFAAGLVYALHGSIERVTTTVFLLTPSYVEVVDNSAGREEPTEATQ